MLQKWKQEKVVKKQQESKLKKPAFKVGVIKPNPPPSLGSKPLFALDTSSRLFKSSFQVSNLQLSGKKQESLNASNTKARAKVFNSQVSANKLEHDAVNIKTSAKEMKIPSSISKIVIPSKPESKWNKNKEQLFSNRKQPTIGSKPPLEIKKIESRLQPLKGKSKVTSLVRDTKSNIPSSGLPKASASRTLSTEAKQIPSVLPRATTSRTLGTETKQAIPKKNSVKSFPKFSKPVTSELKGIIPEKTGRSESKVPAKPKSDYLTTKPNKLATFECELSQIEPVKEERKSFAPPGFMFQPPIELNSSLFLEDGPSAIFMRMKNQLLRTSTPKQSSDSRKSSSETEDSKLLENEVIKSAKDENILCLKDEKKIEDAQCFKNAYNELGSSHKYDLLGSSLEVVSLNDVKPIDCKQSLKFEPPEVVSSQTLEEVLLSSKITHPEVSLITEPTPGRVINPAILPDLFEIDKTEINSTDTRPADDNKTVIPFSEIYSVCSVVIPDSTNIMKPNDCKLLCLKDEIKIEDTQCFKNAYNELGSSHKYDLLSSSLEAVCLNDVKSIDGKQSLKYEPPEVVSTQTLEEVLLSSNVMHPKHSLPREPAPGGVMSPPILSDSVEIDRTEINSNDPEVDSIVSEVIPKPSCIEPDENAKKNQSVSNGFFQKQENSVLRIPERKIRNFKRSEKPGLSSISESLENTPKSALKKKVLDSVFTPRRSLRLAKLSGNFSSLENLLDTPTPKENKDIAGFKGDFTPRRSLRLSKFSTEFSSAENLFDVRRPTFYGTPEKDEIVPKLHSKVTYDFDRLSLETEEETHPHPIRGGKVSLLYTPPNKSRASLMRRSIKGDLMTFTPNS